MSDPIDSTGNDSIHTCILKREYPYKYLIQEEVCHFEKGFSRTCGTTQRQMTKCPTGAKYCYYVLCKGSEITGGCFFSRKKKRTREIFKGE